jgi:hypothetical protein
MNRQTYLARSFTRTALTEILSVDGMATHDLEAVITDIVDAGVNVKALGTSELAGYLAPHEFTDESGMTDAKMAAALIASRTGWSAMLKALSGDVEMIHLHNPALKDEAAVRRHLDQFLAADVDVRIFPLIG